MHGVTLQPGDLVLCIETWRGQPSVPRDYGQKDSVYTVVDVMGRHLKLKGLEETGWVDSSRFEKVELDR